MIKPPLPPVAVLTTREAHDYVGSRPLFEHLTAACGLKPIYDGKGHKNILYRVTAINTALSVLELNGGWNATEDKPLHKTAA